MFRQTTSRITRYAYCRLVSLLNLLLFKLFCLPLALTDAKTVHDIGHIGQLHDALRSASRECVDCKCNCADWPSPAQTQFRPSPAQTQPSSDLTQLRRASFADLLRARYNISSMPVKSVFIFFSLVILSKSNISFPLWKYLL